MVDSLGRLGVWDSRSARSLLEAKVKPAESGDATLLGLLVGASPHGVTVWNSVDGKVTYRLGDPR